MVKKAHFTEIFAFYTLKYRISKRQSSARGTGNAARGDEHFRTRRWTFPHAAMFFP